MIIIIILPVSIIMFHHISVLLLSPFSRQEQDVCSIIHYYIILQLCHGHSAGQVFSPCLQTNPVSHFVDVRAVDDGQSSGRWVAD